MNVSVCEKIGIPISIEPDIGISAQEVRSLFPELVGMSPLDVSFTNDTCTSRTGLNLLTVRYERLVPILIQAIRELTERVEILEEIITSK